MFCSHHQSSSAGLGIVIHMTDDLARLQWAVTSLDLNLSQTPTYQQTSSRDLRHAPCFQLLIEGAVVERPPRRSTEPADYVIMQ